MNKINYQKELDKIIEKNQKENKIPTLLLHSCCAPCSSYCLEYLSKYFKITVFYYNPNINPEAEFRKRVEEQKRLINSMKFENSVNFIEGEYKPEVFFEMAKGMEDLKEGGARCFKCYELRLKETMKKALENKFDYFTTTLTISPLKNSQKLNEIGKEISKEADITYLLSDFKKKEGYKRSIELSRQYDLYRQDYCGCIFSKKQRELEKQQIKLESN